MGTSILIVDDDELVREMVAVRLCAADYRVYQAENGEAALDALAQHTIDLVLMDQMMPCLSGRETLMRMRGDPAYSGIPVIMLSQRRRQSDIELALALGASDYLTKPFCPEELLGTIHKVMDAKRKDTTKRLKVTVFGAALMAAAAPGTASSQEAQPAIVLPVMQAGAVQQPDVEGPEIVAERVEPIALPAETGDRWYASALQSFAWNDANDSDWSETELALTWRPDDRSGYTVQANHARRFGLSDTTLQLRGDWRIGARAGGYAAVVVTPDADFRERFGVRAGLEGGVARGVALGVDTRYGEYPDGPKLSATPRVTVSTAGETLSLTAGYINLWELDTGERYDGWSARLTANPAKRLRLIAGAAQYPEVETGVTRDGTSIYGGASYALTDRVRLSASYANDDYDNLFTLHTLAVGISVLFAGNP